jgi:hypothetical protein
MNQGMWTADRRIFLDANGNAVEEKDPGRVELLVAAGNRIPMARAIALGLAGGAKAASPSKEEAPEPAADAEQAADAAGAEEAEHPDPEAKAASPSKDKAVKPAKDK